MAATLVAASCAPTSPTGGSAAGARPGAASTQRQERTLIVSIEHEPLYVAALAPITGLAATDFYTRPFNAFLDLYDDQNRPLPYLAEALPVLNSDTWTVFPDGRMETRYRLKPNLVWHDGAPLTAEDFAFGFRVATPAAGFRTGTVPYSVMETVQAIDDRSLLIQWKGLYPDAGMLPVGSTRFGLIPFPKHILEQQVAEQSREAFQDNLYWSHEFIGAGPYKLDRWEIGSHIDAVAFDQHVGGRPKIERVRLMFMPDGNTAFANMLAGSTDVALNSITFAHMLQLKREWAPTNRGTGDFTATSLTVAQFQLKPDYVSPRSLLDVRVRKAMAHGVDKKTFGETVWAGEITMMDSIFDPSSAFYPEIDRATVKYPYDPRVSERLMQEAGYAKGADGFFASPTEGKLTPSLAADLSRPELPVLAAGWRQIGFDVQEQGLSSTSSIDAEVRSTFSGLSVSTSGAYENQQMVLYRASEISNAATRWRGENRTGWTNLEYDRLVDAFNTTMDQSERVKQRAQMAQLLTEDLPSIALSYNPNAHAYLSSVKGLTRTGLYTTGRATWNIERWELQ